MQRFERAHALLTHRLNSLDRRLSIVHLNIEQRMYDVQLYDIERSIHERRPHTEGHTRRL